MVYANNETYASEILEMASRKIDDLTFNRIIDVGFNNLTQYQQDQIRAATLEQASYYEVYGTDSFGVKSFSVLDTSVSLADGEPLGTNATVLMLLRPTGLMRRVL